MVAAMERQPADGGRRARLTDQALVAVCMAKQAASAGGRRATVGDLVLGLAGEGEGDAARLLSAHGNALVALHERAHRLARPSPALDIAVAWASGDVADRPVGTLDLLRAACEVGGSDLADLLDSCGLSPAELRGAGSDAAAPPALVETRGFDPSGDPDLDPPVSRAVARTRAAGGGAVTLLLALSLEVVPPGEELLLDPDALSGRLDRLGPLADRTDPAWDAGVDAVLEAARRQRMRPGPLAVLDVVRACALAGGVGPLRLLTPDAPQSP
jgi:hypothetical protein